MVAHRSHHQPTSQRAPDGTVASLLEPVAVRLLGDPLPVQIECWDGSSIGPSEATATLRIESPDAIRRMLWSRGDLGVARAFVAGEIDTDDDIVEVLRILSDASSTGEVSNASVAATLRAAARIGAIGAPPPVPAIERRPRRGRVHTQRSDAGAVSHHYDVSNAFYELVLGASMTYSCARFVREDDDLATAQAAKHEHICRKLGLPDAPGSRLLDVGCGWGSMAIHAATLHDASVVGVTVSRQQAELARERIEAAGVADQVEIRLQDYRDLHGETFDAISSVGMMEHVGARRLPQYFESLRTMLRPHGRLLNHAISSVGSSQLDPDTFIYRYIFPDGELIDVADVLRAMEDAGFEIRDVESLREHYAQTLRAWLVNLDRHWVRAVDEVGEPRARAWKLYMAGSVVGFDDGGNNIHQVLGVAPDDAGASGMPRVRPA